MTTLNITLLGQPIIQYNHLPVQPNTKKAIALLIYLAVTRDICTRDHLIGMFWPELDTENSYAALRNTLYELKKVIGKDYLDIQRGTIGLNQSDGLWVDIEQFHTLLSCPSQEHKSYEACAICAPNLVEAIHLYRGHFLSGFTLRDSAPFEDWHRTQTENLHQEVVLAFQRLLDWQIRGEEYKLAIQYAHHWLALDPLDEIAHRTLIGLYMDTGQYMAAVHQYRECERLLREELGVTPENKTTRIVKPVFFEEIKSTGLKPAAPYLPAYTTSFVDRKEELRLILDNLKNPDCRLVTLVGLGGIGKTRLAVEAARQVTDQRDKRFTDGVCYVPFIENKNTDILILNIIQYIPLSLRGNLSPKIQLLDYLREKKMLLILDNFDHFIGETDFISGILTACPGVKILVTSRVRLNLSGEWCLEVYGLAFPPKNLSSINIKNSAVNHLPAIKLFIQRAKQERAEFELSLENSPWIIRICQLLEGMPLGIELAAGWTYSISCERIAHELEKSLSFLSTIKHNFPERHRSLLAVLDYSWHMLTLQEQQALQKLSIFQSHFSLNAAEYITDISLPTLASLMDKVLLQRIDSGSFHMHGMVRQYVAEKPDLDFQEKLKTRAKYCEYFANFIQNRAHGLTRKKQQKVLKELDIELENIRIAWKWMIELRLFQELDHSTMGVFLYFYLRGYFHEGIDVLSGAIEMIQETNALPSGPSTALLAKLQVRLGSFYFLQGQNAKALSLMQEGITSLEEQSLQTELAFSLRWLAYFSIHPDKKDEIENLCTKSLGIYKDLGDRQGEAHCLRVMANLAWRTGHYSKAKEYCENSLGIIKQEGSPTDLAAIYLLLGAIANDMSQLDVAEQYYEKSIAIYKEINHVYGISVSLNNLAIVETSQKNYRKAIELHQESLKIQKYFGDLKGQARNLFNLGWVYIQNNNLQEAAKSYEASLELYNFLDDPPGMLASLKGCGSVYALLNQFSIARGFLQKALVLAVELAETSPVLSIFNGIAEYLIHTGQTSKALQILFFVTLHAKEDLRIRDEAEKLMIKIIPFIDPKQSEMAQKRGMENSTVSLIEICKEILENGQEEGKI